MTLEETYEIVKGEYQAANKTLISLLQIPLQERKRRYHVDHYHAVRKFEAAKRDKDTLLEIRRIIRRIERKRSREVANAAL